MAHHPHHLPTAWVSAHSSAPPQKRRARSDEGSAGAPGLRKAAEGEVALPLNVGGLLAIAAAGAAVKVPPSRRNGRSLGRALEDLKGHQPVADQSEKHSSRR
eukprot:CAMPEP_0174927030 /NCGR_PEP_ID=MMETSP1355-20121228/17360_1 /TAXON_ID=464990 /ORGANISM="Hemiselmis tepida, Strain CCMP443" /LENGTH=101 /DNA_ID=CAMNT_0016173109 /DNA_START=30 /DNA_END=332 /DNA_ORIENTATION=-